MYQGFGDAATVMGPTDAQLGIETVTGPLSIQIQGSTPSVQSYISELEGWINAAGVSPSTSTGVTAWLNANSKTVLVVAGVGVGILILTKVMR